MSSSENTNVEKKNIFINIEMKNTLSVLNLKYLNENRFKIFLWTVE